MSKFIVAAGVAGVLATAGCAGGAPAGDSIVGSAADRYPSQRIVDWVSYADHVAYFTVLDERELPRGEHEKAHGEGMIDREVTLRVDRTLWSSRAAVTDLPGELVTLTWGWTLKENKKRPFAVHGGPRLEVGRQYLAAWVYTPADGWEQQTNSTVLPVDESGLAQRDPQHGDSAYDEAINMFTGKSPEEILRSLESTAPDPLAERYFYLRPDQRYVAVVLETEMPDRAGFLKAATKGSINHAVLGYVREEDWTALMAAGDVGAEIQLVDEDGQRLDDGITIDDLVLDPAGLTTGS